VGRYLGTLPLSGISAASPIMDLVYGLIVGLFVYRTLKLKDLKKILIASASTTAVVMLIGEVSPEQILLIICFVSSSKSTLIPSFPGTTLRVLPSIV